MTPERWLASACGTMLTQMAAAHTQRDNIFFKPPDPDQGFQAASSLQGTYIFEAHTKLPDAELASATSERQVTDRPRQTSPLSFAGATSRSLPF